MVAEKTSKNFRGLVYFAAPGIFAKSNKQTTIHNRLSCPIVCYVVIIRD